MHFTWLYRSNSLSSSLLELKCTSLNSYSFIPGGGYEDIIELLRLRVEEATVKKRFGLMLFQNNIRKFGKDSTPDFELNRVTRDVFYQIDELIFLTK